MSWTIDYFEQDNGIQPAEVFEDELHSLSRRKMMSRYEQRRRKFLQDPEVAEGYREMTAEFQFVQAIEAIRSNLGISKEDLAS